MVRPPKYWPWPSDPGLGGAVAAVLAMLINDVVELSRAKRGVSGGGAGEGSGGGDGILTTGTCLPETTETRLDWFERDLDILGELMPRADI